jgi:hypothetical protein
MGWPSGRNLFLLHYSTHGGGCLLVNLVIVTRLKKSSTKAQGDAAHDVLEATVTCQYQNSDLQPPIPRTCTDIET